MAIPCLRCGGSGWKHAGGVEEPCAACDGEGEIGRRKVDVYDPDEQSTPRAFLEQISSDPMMLYYLFGVCGAGFLAYLAFLSSLNP